MRSRGGSTFRLPEASREERRVGGRFTGHEVRPAVASSRELKTCERCTAVRHPNAPGYTSINPHLTATKVSSA
jgi:hypothetical protein